MRWQGFLFLEGGNDLNWNLVALGDSTPSGYGVRSNRSYVEIYADYIREDLVVDVTVKNWSSNDLLTLTDHVRFIRSNETLRSDLRHAQVILVWVGWHDLIPHIGTPRGGFCYPRAGEVNLECLRNVTRPMEEGYNLLLSEIVSLANPNKVQILIADVGIPALLVNGWKEDNIFEVLRQNAYEVWHGYIILAAKIHNIRVVPTYKALNGPGGDQVLPPKLVQGDGLHLNEMGHALIADIHRKMGYRVDPKG
jgi:lysophospholipase L1-like esterase